MAADKTKKTTSSATVEAVVLLDSYGWHDESNNPETPRNEAAKGEKIKVSADEFKRGAEMVPPGLAKAGSKEAKAVQGDEPDDEPEEPELTKPDQTPVEPSDDE